MAFTSIMAEYCHTWFKFHRSLGEEKNFLSILLDSCLRSPVLKRQINRKKFFCTYKSSHEDMRPKDSQVGASLVAQWLRICLPLQGTQVRAPVWEDPTCRGATRPVSPNY